MQEIATDRLIGRDTAGSGDPEEISVSGGLEFTGGPGIQRSALTGDVTAPAGSDVTTIANDAVTNAKLADMANGTIKGRSTAGTGDPEDLTAAQIRAVLAVLVPVYWGGADFGAADSGKHFVIQGDALSNAGAAALNQKNQIVMPNSGTIKLLVWNSESATGTTVFKINKNGSVVETLTLTGPSGTLVASTSYVAGDKIAVEYDAGTAPDETTVQLWGQQ
jgi:hypothetical protein